MIDLHQGEKIVFEARRHWIILFGQVFFLICFTIMPLLILAIIPFITSLQFDVKGIPQILVVFLYVCWLNYIWIAIFYVWTNYRLTLWVITNQRIIMIYQFGFFNREKKEIEYEKIQDITVDELGLLAHIFGFGDIHITSASETGGFTMQTISKPDEVRNAISEYIHEEEHIVFVHQNDVTNVQNGVVKKGEIK